MADSQAIQAMASDVEAWQAEKGLDERCVQSFAELNPGDQVIVMDVVNNKECKNVSAFTWSVIRKMREAPSLLRLEFLQRHVDARALDGLSSLPREVQERIAHSVDVLRCRNLSAFVWTQVRAAQERVAPGHPPPPPPMMSMMHAGTIHAAMPGRDRSRSPAALGGNLGLLEQIRHLRAELAARDARDAAREGYAGAGGRLGPGAGWAGGSHGGVASGGSAPLDHEIAALGLDGKASQAVSGLDAEGQRIVVGLVQKQYCRNPSAVAWSMVKMYQQRPMEARYEYVKVNLDGEAASGFERLAPEQREELLSQVDVVKCRNLSAFVWSRVKTLAPAPAGGGARDREVLAPVPRETAIVVPPLVSTSRASLGPPSSRWPPPPPPREEVAVLGDGEFDPAEVLGVGLDSKCTAALRELPREEAIALLQEVNLDTVRNPSAFVWSRVKLLKASPRG